MADWASLYSGEMIDIPANQSGVPTVTDVGDLPTREWGIEGQTVDLDDGGKAILSMIAEDFRAVAETQIRPMLSLIRASVDEHTYTVMCKDFVIAARFYHQGDKEGALQVMGAYMPREMIEAMSESVELA